MKTTSYLFFAVLLVGGSGRADPPPTSIDIPPQVAARTCKEPKKPFASAIAGEHGTVKLRFLISATGSVVDAEIVSSSGSPRLDNATLQAIRLCQWIPGTHDGVPTEMWGPLGFTW